MSATMFLLVASSPWTLSVGVYSANDSSIHGDCDVDGDVDLADYAIFSGCFAGPDIPISLAGCACVDFDQDGDVDAHDAIGFAVLFTGQFAAQGESSGSPHQAAATFLNVHVQAEGGNSIVVGPGEVVQYQVIGELSDDVNEGLAFVVFDLSFSGGDLSRPEPPTAVPMTNFLIPEGITNPLGYAGTPIAGNLVQIGGGQNVIKNTPDNAAFPVGSVITGIAQPASPQVLLSGTLTAPAVEGAYLLAVTDVVAGVIKAGETGQLFWATEFAGPGEVTNLTVEVRGGPPTGACCAADGSCSIVNAVECNLLGGGYLGDSLSCEGDADFDGRDGECGDACPSDPFKTVPGQCGCGVSDVDTDGDTIADCVDRCPGADDRVDANRNGTPDCLEPTIIPAASAWGLAVLALALLTVAKLRFVRRASAA